VNEWPKTPRERRLWIDHGWFEAAAERYRVAMIALGNLPPTPAELAKIHDSGPPDWFVMPRDGHGRESGRVWQRTTRRALSPDDRRYSRNG